MEAYVNRAHCWFDLGRLQLGIDDCTTAIGLVPNDPMIYRNRGQIHLAMGHRAETIADWEKALNLAPADWPQREWVTRELEELKRR